MKRAEASRMLLKKIFLSNKSSLDSLVYMIVKDEDIHDIIVFDAKNKQDILEINHNLAKRVEHDFVTKDQKYSTEKMDAYISLMTNLKIWQITQVADRGEIYFLFRDKKGDRTLKGLLKRSEKFQDNVLINNESYVTYLEDSWYIIEPQG